MGVGLFFFPIVSSTEDWSQPEPRCKWDLLSDIKILGSGWWCCAVSSQYRQGQGWAELVTCRPQPWQRVPRAGPNILPCAGTWDTSRRSPATAADQMGVWVPAHQGPPWWLLWVCMSQAGAQTLLQRMAPPCLGQVSRDPLCPRHLLPSCRQMLGPQLCHPAVPSPAQVCAIIWHSVLGGEQCP